MDPRRPPHPAELILVLLGAPGSGKGTQGRRLAERFGAAYLASGDLLRRAMAQRTLLGEQVRQYVEQGRYVPDEIMVPVAIAELEALGRQHAGLILDGFPRTREQAVALDRALGAGGRRVQAAVLLHVRREVLVSRLADRWTCSASVCGIPYNVRSKPPQVAGRCDRCGAPLYQRDDDRPETVARRLDVALDSMQPLVEHYRQRGCLVIVDGEQPEDQVTAALVRIVPNPATPAPVAIAVQVPVGAGVTAR